MSPPASTNCRKAYMAGRRVRATVSTMRERWLTSIESSIANIPLDCVPRIASNALASSSSSDALRTTLGVRKQTLLALLQRLAADGLVWRAGREGCAVGARTVPVPDYLVVIGSAP